MQDLIRELIRDELRPYVDQFAAHAGEIDELHRRGGNHNRLGVCASVDPATHTCRVKHGELLTPPVKWFTAAAGSVSEARFPSVGEQCLLFNYAGGDNGAQTVALFGLASSQYPLPADSADVHRTRWPADVLRELLNGSMRIAFNAEFIELTVDGVGLRIDAAGAHFIGGSVEHDGTVIDKTHVHSQSNDSGGDKQKDTDAPK